MLNSGFGCVCVCVMTGRLVIWTQWRPVHQIALCRMDQFDDAVTGAACLCLSDADIVCRSCLLCPMPRVFVLCLNLLTSLWAICPSLCNKFLSIISFLFLYCFFTEFYQNLQSVFLHFVAKANFYQQTQLSLLSFLRADIMVRNIAIFGESSVDMKKLCRQQSQIPGSCKAPL